jgi:hypothetical protein
VEGRAGGADDAVSALRQRRPAGQVAGQVRPGSLN